MGFENHSNDQKGAELFSKPALNFQLSTLNYSLNFKLKVWRQKNRDTPGEFVDYEATDISPNASFLEMLDVVNEQLVLRGEEPIAFDSDCREGICGTCALTIDGEAHGPDHPGAACELYMR